MAISIGFFRSSKPAERTLCQSPRSSVYSVTCRARPGPDQTFPESTFFPSAGRKIEVQRSPFTRDLIVLCLKVGLCIGIVESLVSGQ